MRSYTDKLQTQQSRSPEPRSRGLRSGRSAPRLTDNRPGATGMRISSGISNANPEIGQLMVNREVVDNRPAWEGQVQRQKTTGDGIGQQRPLAWKPNKTGLPDNIKTGVETLSGYSLDDVKVHYNSGRPAQLRANAFAQGTDIHVAPGQEKHLPHEAWHIAQQKQGRVKPTRRLDSGSLVNDDETLEQEADTMGSLARRMVTTSRNSTAGVHSDKEHSASLSIRNSTAPIQGSVIQLAMDHTELNKLQTFLSKYIGVIGDEALNEIWNRFGSGYDTLEQAMPDLKHALEFAKRQAEIRKFRINATSYPRVFLAGDDPETRKDFNIKMDEKQKGKGFDLSYRKHVDLIDTELDQFLPEGEFDRSEQRELYYQAIRESKVSMEERKKKGMFSVTAQGGLPLTTSTPQIMEHYHAMHYAPVLKRPDETQSTRTYESEYVGRASKSLNPELFRAFFLPPGSDAEPDQETMLNTLGASLDSNTPTKGNTIGSGKINSMVFLHFKKGLELLNTFLDTSEKGEDVKDFEKRTMEHINYLREYSFKGMLANEEEHAKGKDSQVSWDALQPMIMQAQTLILQMMHALARSENLPEFEINTKDKHVLEKLRVVGTLLGLMIKTEKRILINHVLLNQGSEETGVQLMTNLKNLNLVEKKINEALALHGEKLKALGK